MLNWFRRSLTTKMILGFLVVALVPLAIMISLYFDSLTNLLIENTEQNLQIGAQQTVQSLDTFFEETSVNLRAMTQLSDIIQYVGGDQAFRDEHEHQLSNVFHSMSRVKDEAYLQTFLLLDEHGRVIYDHTRLDIGADFSSQEFFTRAWETQIPQITFTPESRNGQRSLYFSTLIWDQNGEKLGVLAARYNLNIIPFLTGESSNLAGPNTFAIVTESDGRVIGWSNLPNPPLEIIKFRAIEHQNFYRNIPLNDQTYALVLLDLEIAPLHVFYLKTEPSITSFVRSRTEIIIGITIIVTLLAIIAAVFAANRSTKPIKALTNTSIALSEGDWTARVSIDDIDEVGQLAATFNQMADHIHSEYDALENAYLETVLALARAIESRDSYTGDHSHDISIWTEEIARRLGCTDDTIRIIYWASLLHDIGKIGVPDQVLHKPGPLTDEEWEIMKTHPDIGANIIEPIESLAGVAELVRAHQERYDGSGYPQNLKGEEIPIGARILAVVDAFSAMTDTRVYRKARTPEEAIEELRHCAGTHFDPQVVEIFLDILLRTEA